MKQKIVILLAMFMLGNLFLPFSFTQGKAISNSTLLAQTVTGSSNNFQIQGSITRQERKTIAPDQYQTKPVYQPPVRSSAPVVTNTVVEPEPEVEVETLIASEEPSILPPFPFWELVDTFDRMAPGLFDAMETTWDIIWCLFKESMEHGKMEIEKCVSIYPVAVTKDGIYFSLFIPNILIYGLFALAVIILVAMIVIERKIARGQKKLADKFVNSYLLKQKKKKK